MGFIWYKGDRLVANKDNANYLKAANRKGPHLTISK